MGQLEKFLFDTSFDSQKGAKAEAAAPAQAVAEEPPAPTFSEAEMAAARDAAFAEGRAAGVAEAEAAQAARLATAVEALPPQLAEIARDIAAGVEERRRGALDAALAVVRKLFPRLARDHGLAEVGAVIEECLERLRDEPRVVLRCADADLDALRERAERSAGQDGFEGKLVLLADDRLEPGDLRVEWADGGAERNQAALWQEIDAVIARALATAGVPGGGKAEPAQTAGARQQTPKPAASQAAATPSPRPGQPAGVQPLRRAHSA